MDLKSLGDQSKKRTMCRRRNGEDQIFECSIFQNIVENMILYFETTDDEIVSFYKKLRTVIGDREFRTYALPVVLSV